MYNGMEKPADDVGFISTPTALATLSNLRRPSQPPFSIVAILAFAAGNIVVGDVDCRRTQLIAAETQLSIAHSKMINRETQKIFARVALFVSLLV